MEEEELPGVHPSFAIRIDQSIVTTQGIHDSHNIFLQNAHEIEFHFVLLRAN